MRISIYIQHTLMKVSVLGVSIVLLYHCPYVVEANAAPEIFVSNFYSARRVGVSPALSVRFEKLGLQSG